MNFPIYKFLKPSFLLAGAVSLLVSCNKELPQATPIVQPAPTGSTITTLLNDPSFSILKAAVAKAAPAASSGLQPLSALFSDNSAVYTFFAPTNTAFQNAGIPEAAIAVLSPGRLDTLLRYHLVGGQKVTSSMIPTAFANIQLPTSLVLAPPSATIPPGLRMSIFPSKRGSNLWVNNIPITQADLDASNGVIHKVAVVVAPANGAYLWNRIEADPELSYLEAAIKRADQGVAADSTLQAGLSNPGANLTVFAPTDAAFRAILTGLITQALMAQGMDQNTAQQRASQLAATPDVFTNPAVTPVLTQQLVKGMVVYHILGTRAFSVNIPTTDLPVRTLLNTAIAAHPGVIIKANFGQTGVAAATVKGAANATPSNILINPTPVSGTSDQHYINGVIHKIDQVLRPQ